MTTASEVDIANMALGHLGEDDINSFDDNTVRANKAKLYYPRARDLVLESAEWSFALTRFSPSPDATPPSFRWGVRYLIPSDILRVVSVDLESELNLDHIAAGRSIPEQVFYEKIGNYIETNESKVWMLGIKRITSTGDFTENFANALSYRLAAYLAIPITRSQPLFQDMMAAYNIALDDADTLDGMVGRSKRIRSRYLTNRR